MPIAMRKAEWDRIVKWTQPNKEDPAVQQRRELVQHMDKISREMTKTWPNSLENVNKRNEEQRRARQEAAESANAQFYARHLRSKQRRQERLMRSARDEVFKNKDAPKLLVSAVIESCTQKELEVQRAFNKMLRDKEAAKKNENDEEIRRKAVEWHRRQEEMRKHKFEVNKKHQAELLEQAHEIAERKRKEYETELNCQKIDVMRANEEIQLIKEFEEKMKADERQRIFNSMEEAKAALMKRRLENEARDKMDDRLIEVLNRSKCRVEQTRRNTEKRLKEEKLRILEDISKKLHSGDEARAAAEQASLEKAIKEKEEIEKKRHQMDAEKKAKSAQMKQEMHRQFLEDEERRLQEMNARKQWEMINRFKNCEIYDDYVQKQKDEKIKKIQEYREEILRLMKERSDREALAAAELREHHGSLAARKLRAADNKLLTYADQLVQEAVRNHRPPLAIYKAIDRYCKMYRLYPMPELYASLKEHFQSYQPADLSRPDPDYREPAGAGAGAGAPVGAPAEGRRDGMQEMQPPPASARPPRPPPPPPRAAPANGLQQRNEIQFVLPPITAIPCQLVTATPYIELQPEHCYIEDNKINTPTTTNKPTK